MQNKKISFGFVFLTINFTFVLGILYWIATPKWYDNLSYHYPNQFKDLSSSEAWAEELHGQYNSYQEGITESLKK